LVLITSVMYTFVLRLKAIKVESMRRISRSDIAGRRDMKLGWMRRIVPWMMAPRRSHVKSEILTCRMLRNCRSFRVRALCDLGRRGVGWKRGWTAILVCCRWSLRRGNAMRVQILRSKLLSREQNRSVKEHRWVGKEEGPWLFL